MNFSKTNETGVKGPEIGCFGGPPPVSGLGQIIPTLELRNMMRLIYILTFLSQTIAYAQVDSVVQKISLPHLEKDLFSSRIEKSAALPAKVVENTYSITITVTNIRNNKGVIRFKFYDDKTPFPDKNGFLKVVVAKSEFTGNSFTRTFYGFTSKNMAIALLDDENNNVKLDMGWILPKEGHAFSDYYHLALRRPVYHDFDFFLSGDKKVVMKMKYY